MGREFTYLLFLLLKSSPISQVKRTSCLPKVARKSVVKAERLTGLKAERLADRRLDMPLVQLSKRRSHRNGEATETAKP